MRLSSIKKANKNLVIFIAFLFGVAFLRTLSFFKSSLDWDESVYFLMSCSILEGQIPYTMLWDHKPPGIYILFSLAQILFGKSIFSIRLIACIAVSITCYLLYLMGEIFDKNDTKVGLFAAIFYAVMSLYNGGLASNIEIMLAPFVTLAFYLLLKNREGVEIKSLRLLLIGLLHGIALQFKYVVIFDFVAILIIVGLDLYLKNRGNIKPFMLKLLRSYIILLVGPVLLFVVVFLYFLLNRHFNEYFYANFTANLIYSKETVFSLIKILLALKNQVTSFFILWGCLMFTPFYLVLSKKSSKEEKIKLVYLLIWFLLGFLGACFTKRFYGHYFLEPLPPLTLISSYVIIKVLYPKIKLNTNVYSPSSYNYKYLILVIFLIGSLLWKAFYRIGEGVELIYYRYIKGMDNCGDTPAVISDYLQEQIKKGDYIYVADYEPIIYYLVKGVKIPTKYVLPVWLLDKNSFNFPGIEALVELDSIMKAKPAYVIKQINRNEEFKDNQLFYNKLEDYLKKDYLLEKTVEGVGVYKLKNIK